MPKYLKKELFELIKQNESIFDFLHKSSIDGIWFWDTEQQNNLWVGQGFLNRLNYSIDEISNKLNTWQSIIDLKELQKIKNKLENNTSPDTPIKKKIHYTQKNGNKALGDLCCIPVRDKQQNIIRILGINRKITLTKLNKNQETEFLDKNEEIYRFLIEYTSDVIRYQSSEGEFNYISPNIYELTGYTAEEYSRFSPLENVVSEDHNLLNKTIDSFSKGENFQNIKYRIYHKNRDVIWLESRINCIRNKDEEVIALISSTNNITNQKKLHLALKESEEKYKAMYINAPLAFQSLDIEGKILDVNPQWLKMLKYNKDDVIGKWFGEFLHHDYVERFIVNFSQFKSQGQINDVQFRMRQKNGKYIYVSLEGCIGYTQDGEFKQTYCTFKDITAEQDAEQKLLKANKDLHTTILREEAINERFNLAMEATSDGLWDWNLLTNEIYFSSSWKKMLGYDDKELPNDFSIWENLTLKKDVNRSWDMVNDLISGKRDNYDIIIKMKHKNGQWIEINSRANVFFNEGGKAYRVVGIHTDITEKIKLERKIRESEEMLRLAIDKSPLGICIIDMKGKFISTNAAYKDIVGYSEEELRQQTLFDITHQDYLLQNKKLFKNMSKNGESGYNYEKKYIKKGGNLVDVRVHTKMILNKQNKQMFSMAFVEDITTRKTLESRNRMLYKAIESSPVSVILTTPKGKIEYVNPFFTKMTGYKKTDIIGKNPRILKSGKQTDEFYKDMWNTIISGESWKGQFYNKRKNGELFWENAVISPIFDSNGKISQFIAIKEDITELKETLSDLQLAKEKAEESNALKNEFLHNMSHEIRTPMNGIMGFSNLLCELEDCTDMQKNYTSIINNSSTQLLNIINDILEISTLETKQIEVNESEFDINQFILELYSIYEMKSKERKIPLYLKKGLKNDNSLIISDKTKISKILSNLLDNAFKFTTFGKIEFGYDIKNENIVFYVKDTGIGISRDKQNKVFERFSQESSQTAQRFGGLGLGLSIAKENTELLGGRLTIQSERNIGSTFYVEIPYKTNIKPNQTNIKVNKLKNENTFNILVAEDEESNYLYIEAVIETIHAYNIKVTHVTNGRDAVDACLKDDTFDLVLMDIKMPILNGLLATKNIKSKKPKLPIIAQTAYSTISEKEIALQHGCDDFISKPIRKETLLEIIKEYSKVKY